MVTSSEIRGRRIMPWWGSGGLSCYTTYQGSNTGAHNLHTRVFSMVIYRSQDSTNKNKLACIFIRLTEEMDRPLYIRTSPRIPTPASEGQMLEEFWRKKKEEIEAIEDFGERAIPMTRLRKIMGAEKGNMLMTFDTPSFLTKACEIFVQELAFRAWMRASSHHRSVILDTDIAEAIATTESYDFLKDILHTFREEHNSISCSKPTSKKPHISTNQQSTSHHSPLNQVPQFHPQYSPSVRIPHPSLPIDVHPMSMPFPFPLPQVAPPLMSTIVTPRPITMMAPINYMATGSGVFGNGTDTTLPSNFVMSNNIVASGVMPHPLLQVCAGATTNIPDTSFYLSMISASAPAYVVGGATNSSTAAAPGQRAGAERVHILPEEVAETASMIHAYGSDNNDAHQQQRMDLDQVDGTLDMVVASARATNASGGNYDASWDEFVIPDDSFMSKFWEDIMMEDNPAPLPDATTSTDLLTSDMQDLEGPRNESYLLDDLSPTEAQAVAGSPI